MKARAARFALVGTSGVIVNFAALHLFAGVLGIHEVVASALAIETSILTNFLFNDGFTFHDRRLGSGLLRLPALSRGDPRRGVVQLATFALVALALRAGAGWGELGALRYAAQGTGIAIAFLLNYLGSLRFAWGRSHRGRRSRRRSLERGSPRPSSPASSCRTCCPSGSCATSRRRTARCTSRTCSRCSTTVARPCSSTGTSRTGARSRTGSRRILAGLLHWVDR